MKTLVSKETAYIQKILAHSRLKQQFIRRNFFPRKSVLIAGSEQLYGPKLIKNKS